MKLIGWLLSLLLVSLSAHCCHAEATKYKLRTVHLNAQWLFLTKDALPLSCPWRKEGFEDQQVRLKHIDVVADYLAGTDADLIHLTEVEGDEVLALVTAKLNAHAMNNDKPDYHYYLVRDEHFHSDKKICKSMKQTRALLSCCHTDT